MAEGIVAVGLAGSVIQFVDFSTKLMKRLQEFQSSLDEMQNIFSDLTVKLPLLKDTFERLSNPADLDHTHAPDKEKLKVVVQRCTNQVEFLERELSKAIPNENEALKSRRWKAICSLAREKRVKEVVKSLLDTSTTLILHQSVESNTLTRQMSDRLAALESVVRSAKEPNLCPSRSTKYLPFYGPASYVGQTANPKVIQSCDEKAPDLRAQPERPVRSLSAWRSRSDIACSTKGCVCSCHKMLIKSGRFWSYKLPSIPELFATCDRASCSNKFLKTHLQFSLSRFGILRLVNLQMGFSWGEGGLSMSLMLRPSRIVNYTSPGFVVLWKCRTGQISFSEARTELMELFREGRASPDDVDPSGATWLEVSEIQHFHSLCSHPT